MQEHQLELYLSKGIERMIREMIKVSVTVPGKGAFFLKFGTTQKKAGAIRKRYELEGTHIPPFLIASITSQCNLTCKGCYAHAQQADSENCQAAELSKNQWRTIFNEAAKLGIPFILLAGGEPLTRTEILAEAGLHKQILFPVFTNGTLMDEHTLGLFAIHHNLIPILSVEGGQCRTDERRGRGVYTQVMETMRQLTRQKTLFGVSVTVTSENYSEVLSESFVHKLQEYGCKALIYVDYVPVDKKSTDLALTDEQRVEMSGQLQELRQQETGMLFISFPGDEKASGGCLAAGRGFFHINASGGAEPCPFSPYSDTDVVDSGLKEALGSPLFVKIRSGPLLAQDHRGGCVLFEQEEQVKSYWRGAPV